MTKGITKNAKVRVVIEDIILQTPAGNLRAGSISTCLYDAWNQFETEHKASGIIGLSGSYYDSFSGRNYNIQFDLY